MEYVESLCSNLAAQVARMSNDKFLHHSTVPQVTLMYAEKHHPRTPVLYNPGIVILFQGSKVGYLGKRTFSYDPKNYLMLTVPLPFECETFASAEQPMAGIQISINTVMLQDLLMDMEEAGFSGQKDQSSGISSGVLDEDILCAAERLLDSMEKPLRAKVLGPQIIREILFMVLTSDNGGALQALVNRHTHFSQISKALRRIEAQYAENLSAEPLAETLAG